MTPVKRKVRGIFIPVADIERARQWYRDVLDLPVGEVEFGHLCCIPMDDGLDLLLDQKLTPDEPGPHVKKGDYPLFMFATDDIHASLRVLQQRGVELVEYGGSIVQDGRWFNFLDSEGNMLMVCGPA